MKIIVVGAGAWGTALAIRAAQRHAVTLWARDPVQADALRRERVNARYLPGSVLPPAVQVLAPAVAGEPPGAADAGGPGPGLAPVAAGHDLVLLATPVAGLRAALRALADLARPVVWLCKGFEAGGAGQGARLGHEILAEEAPQLAGGVFSGPSFAREVAAGLPAALVAASSHAAVRQALVQAFHGPTLRVYSSDDVIGVEVGGAVKNVLAIACGLSDGLDLGHNARAALITRGLAEMTRLGVALGGRSETFMGLSGLGDLVLTATGDLSRNRRLGLLLAAGEAPQAAMATLGHVAEGMLCAREVAARAAALGVDMPICAAVADMLDGRLAPRDALARLMGREPGVE